MSKYGDHWPRPLLAPLTLTHVALHRLSAKYSMHFLMEVFWPTQYSSSLCSLKTNHWGNLRRINYTANSLLLKIPQFHHLSLFISFFHLLYLGTNHFIRAVFPTTLFLPPPPMKDQLLIIYSYITLHSFSLILSQSLKRIIEIKSPSLDCTPWELAYLLFH